MLGTASDRLHRFVAGRGPVLCLVGCILAQGVPWLDLGLPPTPLSDLLVFTAFGWGAYHAVRDGRPAALAAWPLLMGSVGVALALVAAMGSPQPLLAFQGLVRIIQVFLVTPGAFLLAIRSRRDLRLVVGSMVALFTLQAVMNVYQNLTGHGALIAGEPIRGVGTFGPAQIQVSGAMVSAGLAVATAMIVSYPGRRRLVGVLLAVVLWAGLIAALARAAWLGAAAITMLLLTRYTPRRAVVVAAGSAVAGYALILVAKASNSALGDRLLSVFDAEGGTPDQSGLDRLSLWTAARAILDDYPFFGLGPRQFQAHRDAYAPLTLLGSSDIGSAGTFARQALLSPHNLYYLLSTEFGIPAAGAFIFIVVAAFLIGIDRLRRTPANNAFAWVVGLTATGFACNFFMNSVFGDLGGSGTLLVSWAVGFAVWWAAHDRRMLAPAREWDDGVLPVEPDREWWRWGDRSTVLSRGDRHARPPLGRSPDGRSGPAADPDPQPALEKAPA